MPFLCQNCTFCYLIYIDNSVLSVILTRVNKRVQVHQLSSIVELQDLATFPINKVINFVILYNSNRIETDSILFSFESYVTRKYQGAFNFIVNSVFNYEMHLVINQMTKSKQSNLKLEMTPKVCIHLTTD